MGLIFQGNRKWNEQCDKMIKSLHYGVKKNNKTWKNPIMIPAAKFKMYKTCSLSKLMYGCPALEFTKNETGKINIAVNKCINKVLNFHPRSCSLFLRMMTNTLYYENNAVMAISKFFKSWSQLDVIRYPKFILNRIVD